LFIAGKTTLDMLLAEGFVRTTLGTDAVRVSAERAAGGVLLYLQTSAAPADTFVLTRETIVTPKDTAPGTITRTIVSPRSDALLRLKPASDAVSLPTVAVSRFDLCEHGEQITLPVAIARDGSLAVPFPSLCRSAVFALTPF